MRLSQVLGVAMLGSIAFSAVGQAAINGTSVTGTLRFVGNKNLFDPTNGHVPDGYGNSASATVTISNPQIEFGYQDLYGHITADFNNGRLTMTESILSDTSAGDSQSERYSFADTAFEGLTPVLISNAYPVSPTVTLVDDTLSINLPAGYASKTGDTLGMSFAITRPGDADLDGKVDFNDFLALQANFGASNTTFAQGNFNNDGVTDFNDFLALQANFGQSVNGAAVQVTSQQVAAMTAFATNAVPEPATLGVLSIAAAGLLSRRRTHA